MSDVIEPTAKRVRLDSPQPDSADIVLDLVAPVVAAPPRELSRYEKSVKLFSFEGETGMFGAMKDSIGVAPVTEEEVGITEYMDPSIAAITGIIKHRFTDFLVFEVNLEGETIRLKDINFPKGPVVATEIEEGAPVASGSAEPAKVEVEPIKKVVAPVAAIETLWNDTSEAAMAALLTPELLADLKSFVLAGPPNKASEFNHKRPTALHSEVQEVTPAWTKKRTYFRSAVMDSKDERTTFHRVVRECFKGKFLTEMKELDNKDQVIEIKWNVKSNRTRDNREPGQKQAERPPKVDAESFPPYIHFTLQKTNREMHDALAGICRTLHIANRDLGTAGTKDKRAITMQRVSLKRGTRTLAQVFNAARPGGGGGARGGRGGRGGARGGYGGNTGERGVRIGDLEYKDYGFDLGMLKGNKFVITLRDVQADSPLTIEKAMSTLRMKGFINYYGMQRFGTAPVPTQAIGLALLRSNWALAANLILRPRFGEADDATESRKIFAETGDAERAMKKMPRRCVAEKAVLEHYHYNNNTDDHLSALGRIPKNLRMMYVHGWQSYIWNRVLSERVKLHGCEEPVVGDLVYLEGSGSGEGQDEEVIDEDGETVVIELDAEPEVAAVDATSDNNPPPVTHSGKPMLSKIAKARALTAQDIASKKYSIFDVILPMPGYAIIYPEGVLGDRYKEIMLEDGLDWKNLFRPQKEYSLGGTYRKILHLPAEVTHRLIPYSDPNVDLAQSDEDILMRKRLPNPVMDGDENPMYTALQIELTLGSSTYATMALRELLKTRTSGAHQKELTLGMEARAAFVAEGVVDTAADTEMKVDADAEDEEREEREREERMEAARREDM